MPKKSVKENEKKFVTLYLKYGAVEECIANCERRSRLKPGSGKKILARKTIQKQINQQLEPVRMQQMRQAVIAEATDKAVVRVKEEISAKVSEIHRQGLDETILIHELMTGAIVLNVHQHPGDKLAYIKAGLVLVGSLESTSLGRRIQPLNEVPGAQSNVYESIFDRPRLTESTAPTTLESPSGEPADLFPQPARAVTPVPTIIPPMGESIIEEKPAAKPSRIITVEVG